MNGLPREESLSSYDCSCGEAVESNCDCSGSVVCAECGKVLCCKAKDQTRIRANYYLCPLCQDSLMGNRKHDVLIFAPIR